MEASILHQDVVAVANGMKQRFENSSAPVCTCTRCMPSGSFSVVSLKYKYPGRNVARNSHRSAALYEWMKSLRRYGGFHRPKCESYECLLFH